MAKEIVPGAIWRELRQNALSRIENSVAKGMHDYLIDHPYAALHIAALEQQETYSHLGEKTEAYFQRHKKPKMGIILHNALVNYGLAVKLKSLVFNNQPVQPEDVAKYLRIKATALEKSIGRIANPAKTKQLEEINSILRSGNAKKLRAYNLTVADIDKTAELLHNYSIAPRLVSHLEWNAVIEKVNKDIAGEANHPNASPGSFAAKAIAELAKRRASTGGQQTFWEKMRSAAILRIRQSEGKKENPARTAAQQVKQVFSELAKVIEPHVEKDDIKNFAHRILIAHGEILRGTLLYRSGETLTKNELEKIVEARKSILMEKLALTATKQVELAETIQASIKELKSTKLPATLTTETGSFPFNETRALFDSMALLKKYLPKPAMQMVEKVHESISGEMSEWPGSFLQHAIEAGKKGGRPPED